MKKLVSCLFAIVCFGGLGSLYWQNHQTEAQIIALNGRLLAVQTQKDGLMQSLAAETATPPSAHDEAARPAIEKAVEDIHQLKYTRPIRFGTMKTSEFKNFMSAKINEVYSQEELRTYGRAMALLGLVPEGTDIGKVVLSLYNEQVAAFYDQQKGLLYTFSDYSLSRDIDRMLLAHEMTHALQDQNFDLKKFPLDRKDNDDLNLATSALIEGDATLLMTLWYMQNLAAGFDAGSVMKDLGSMLSQNTDQLQAAPAYFRQTLLFPYQQGNEFVMALYQKGGYGEINKAFLHPPVSTKQILHPDKFVQREDPVDVPMPALKIDGWKPAFTNVVGELGTRILLEQTLTPYEAGRAADGWGGDRYVVFDDGKGRLALVWISTWESDADAREFEEAMDASEHKRMGTTMLIQHAADESGFLNYGSDTFDVAIRKTSSTVTVVLGSKEDVNKVMDALAH